MNIALNKQLQTDKNFKQAYETYYHYIYTLIYKRIHCYDTALDITQETFILYLEKIKKIKNPKSWLAQVAIFKAINYFRSNKNHEELSNLSITTDCITKKYEAKVILEKAVTATNLKDLDVYILEESILQKRYFTDIAKQLNLTRRQVEYTYKRSIKKLQNHFNEIGIKNMMEII